MISHNVRVCIIPSILKTLARDLTSFLQENEALCNSPGTSLEPIMGYALNGSLDTLSDWTQDLLEIDDSLLLLLGLVS